MAVIINTTPPQRWHNFYFNCYQQSMKGLFSPTSLLWHLALFLFPYSSNSHGLYVLKLSGQLVLVNGGNDRRIEDKRKEKSRHFPSFRRIFQVLWDLWLKHSKVLIRKINFKILNSKLSTKPNMYLKCGKKMQTTTNFEKFINVKSQNF